MGLPDGHGALYVARAAAVSFGEFGVEPGSKAEIVDLMAHIAALERELEEATKVIVEYKAHVFKLQREVAEGFKVHVTDVTNDPAMLAENGLLKRERDEDRAAIRDVVAYRFSWRRGDYMEWREKHAAAIQRAAQPNKETSI